MTVVLLITPARRRLVERTAREIVVFNYEPRTRLDKVRTGLRRELTGDGRPGEWTRVLEDQLERLIRAEVDRLSFAVPMPRRPGGDAA
jgi:hypothetical protein